VSTALQAECAGGELCEHGATGSALSDAVRGWNFKLEKDW
jgi:hypothetical protein